MITDLSRETDKQYGAYLVVAWENTSVSDYDHRAGRDVQRQRSEPKVYTCNTVEELAEVLDDCKARHCYPIDSFKTTKVVLKQAVYLLDVEE
jgi:hypothetical protein